MNPLRRFDQWFGRQLLRAGSTAKPKPRPSRGPRPTAPIPAPYVSLSADVATAAEALRVIRAQLAELELQHGPAKDPRDSVRVKLLKGVTLSNHGFLRPGTTVRVTRDVAEILEREGSVRILEEGQIDTETVYR